MYSTFSILFFTCNLFIYSKADISDLRACADPQCERLIATGRTIQLYMPKEEGVLSFSADEVVSIYSKEAGSNTDLWGVKINGKSGYIPKKFVREEKVYEKKLDHVVPTSNKSSDKSYKPNSDTNQENTISLNSDSKADTEISSSNVKKSNIHKTFLDEVVLTSEDAEFAALNALSSKGERRTVESSLNDGNENKEVENFYKEESGIPVTSKIDSLSSIANEEGSQASIDKIAELQAFVDRKEGSQIHFENKLESHLEGSQYVIDTEVKLPFPVDSKEESQVLADSKLETHVPLDNKEESVIAMDGKEGFQVPKGNKEVFKVPNELQPEVQNLNTLDNKERINLEQFNKGSKIEEEVGNNEGNGNEGEDNGSEYIGDWSSEHHKEEPLDGGSTQSTSSDKPKLSLAEEENGKEFEKNSPSPESFSFVTSESVTDIILSKPSKEAKEIFDMSSSDNQMAKPTPSKIQVVDGTTIRLDESDTYQPSTVSELKGTTYSDLESSSDKQDNSNVQSTTPTPRLPDGTLLTQPPLIVKNFKITTESMSLKNSQTVTPIIDKVTSALGQEKSWSESYSQNENVGSLDGGIVSPNEQNEQEGNEEADLEFSSVKPETVLENNIQDYTNIGVESKVEITDNSHSNKLNNEVETSSEINNILSDETGQAETSDILENMLSDLFISDDPVNVHDSYKTPVESQKDYRNEISVDKSSHSLQDEVTPPSIHERNFNDDTKKDENGEHSDGIFSSISSIFNYESKTDEKNSKQEPPNELQGEYSQKYKMESGDVGETSSDNSNATSDFTGRSIPFIDPFSEAEVPKNFPDILHSVDVESNDFSNAAENPEELDLSSSFKKKLLHVSEAVLSEGMALAVEGELADPHLSKGTVTFLLVVAVTIIFLYISHMCFVKWSRESPLLENLNKLDRNHRVLIEENINLKRQLTDSNGQIKSAMTTDPIALKNLKQHLEETQKRLVGETEDLRERNQQLEAELEASTANEVELHRMLDELLANQRDTTNFEDSVNSLQSMLDSQREIVENLTSDLALKTRLNEELRNELKAGKSKVSKLEYQIEQLMLSLEETNTLKQDLIKKLASEEENSLLLREMNSTLRQEASKTSKESESHYQEVQKLLKDIRKLKQSLHTKETECQISKECLKKLQIFSDSGGNNVLNKLSEIFNFIEDKTQVESVQYENSFKQTQLEEKDKIISSLSEELKRSKCENASLKSSSERLQKEKNDAESKLKVLSQYYEEKEAGLKKALESQEDLRQSAEGSVNLVSNRIQTYELELASRKSLIESLKTELEEQKQSHKIQLANEEKKLHDIWLSARTAERRQEELRQENTQLRQSFTQLQRDADSKTVFNKPPPKRVDANGSISSPIPVENDISASLPPGIPPLDLDGTMPPLPPPPMMFPPPPPGLPPLPPRMFGPLPPPHHHPPLPDRRLPPAGRIASPPGYDRRSYSPESERSRYSDHRYSPGPPSTFSSNNQRGSSPDRRSDHMRRNIRRGTHRSPSLERHSPRERWYNQSPTGAPPKNHRTPPLDYYDSAPAQERRGNPTKGKKTSTPIGPNDR